MPEVIRCPNCVAPLRLDVGPVVVCAYCGAQCRLDSPGATVPKGVQGGTRLADTVSFVTPSMTIPFLDRGAPLPLYRTETLSTQRDDQDALDVNLVQGQVPIVRFSFPIHQRGPRGVPKVALTVRVAANGAMSVTVAEPSTPNIVDRDQLSVAVS